MASKHMLFIGYEPDFNHPNGVDYDDLNIDQAGAASVPYSYRYYTHNVFRTAAVVYQGTYSAELFSSIANSYIDNYILSVGGAGGFAHQNESFTWEVAIRLKAVGAIQPIVENQQAANDYLGFSFYVNASGNLELRVGDAVSGYTIITGPTVLAADRWYYVMVVADAVANTVSLVVDGTADITTSLPVIWDTGYKVINLGRRTDVGSIVFFSGFMDRIRYFQDAQGFSPALTPPNPDDPIIDTDPIIRLSMEGANGTTNITDSGPNQFTVGVQGGAQHSTAQFQIGTSSLYLDNSTPGDYLFVDDATGLFAVRDGPLTIEAWVYLSSVSEVTDQMIFADGFNNKYEFGITPAGKLFFRNIVGAVTDTIVGATTLSTGVWQHVVMSKTGPIEKKLYLFVDGVQDNVGDEFYYADLNPDSGTTLVGRTTLSPSSDMIDAYIDNLVVWPYQKYFAVFTPPTDPFPDEEPAPGAGPPPDPVGSQPANIEYVVLSTLTDALPDAKLILYDFGTRMCIMIDDGSTGRLQPAVTPFDVDEGAMLGYRYWYNPDLGIHFWEYIVNGVVEVANRVAHVAAANAFSTNINAIACDRVPGQETLLGNWDEVLHWKAGNTVTDPDITDIYDTVTEYTVSPFTDSEFPPLPAIGVDNLALVVEGFTDSLFPPTGLTLLNGLPPEEGDDDQKICVFQSWLCLGEYISKKDIDDASCDC